MTMFQGLEFGAEHVRFAASDHASKERLSHIENSHFFCKHGHHSNTIDYNSLLGWLCVCLLFLDPRTVYILIVFIDMEWNF